MLAKNVKYSKCVGLMQSNTNKLISVNHENMKNVCDNSFENK